MAPANYVVDNSTHVQIDEDKIAEYCASFDASNIHHWLDFSPFNIKVLSYKDRIHFLVLIDSISFCYWGNPKWTIEYKGQKLDGSWALIASLGAAIEKGYPLTDFKYMSQLSEQDFNKITKGNVKMPLNKQRHQIINEIGSVIWNKYGGDFTRLINESNGDAIQMLHLLISNIPNFSDFANYRNKIIYFYKRAQLLIADIHQESNPKEIFSGFFNISQLTACADYKIPQVLRRLGIFKYSHGLKRKILNKIEIPRGSTEEIEIRANTIWAVELIKNKLKESDYSVESYQINDILWLAIQIRRSDDEPYHLTGTTAY